MAFSAFILAGCYNNTSSQEQPRSYRVRRVIDGDTIELTNGKKVRYIGIDTPEIRKRKGKEWIFSPEVYGVEAKERNAELVDGKVIELEYDLEIEDKYGRQLAYVHADGVMVNEILVKEGFATVYTFPPNTKYFNKMIRWQREAFEAGKGLWATIKNIKANEAVSYGGVFCVVSGRVSAHDVFPGGISLNVVSDLPGMVNVLIFNRNLSLFYMEGIDPLKDYNGKYVEVIGKIGGSDIAPEIIVDNPFQINMLKE